jgi:hypothetical protein
VNYHITAVDTTQEGHLYVVVDFGDGWIEDFIFPDLKPRIMAERYVMDPDGLSEHLISELTEVDVLGTIQRIIEAHGAKGFSGWRVDPNIVLSGPDPYGTKAIARALLP